MKVDEEAYEAAVDEDGYNYFEDMWNESIYHIYGECWHPWPERVRLGSAETHGDAMVLADEFRSKYDRLIIEQIYT